MIDIAIEQIRPELTWRLRQKVLYPQLQLHEMELDEDRDGYHFGVFHQNRLAAVVSLFQHDDAFQFRKLAVEPSLQNQGIGSELLQYIINFALNEHGVKLWCNARLTAVPFYLKHSFVQTGRLFSKNGVDYEVLEKALKG